MNRLSKHALLLAACTSSALLLSGCSLFRAPSGNQPAKLTKIESPEVRANRQWAQSLGQGGAGAFSGLVPVMRGGVAYAAGAKGRVTAVSVDNGDTLWSVDTDYRWLGGPGWGGKSLLLGTRDGEVVALSSEDGSLLWAETVSSEVLATPVRVDEVVVARGGDGRIYGLDLQTGQRRWVFERAAPALTLRGVSAPVPVDARSVLIGLDNGKLVVLNTLTGEPLWERTVSEPSGRTELERIADVDAALLVEGSRVFAASFGGDIVAFSMTSGREVWRQQLSTYSGMALDDNGRLYVTTESGDVAALNSRTGAKVWDVQTLAYRGLTAPTLFKGNLVVGDSKGYLHWISPVDGRIVGRREIGGTLRAAPISYDGKLFVYTEDGKLHAVTAESTAIASN